MICPECGRDDVAEGMNSCPNCGAGISKNSQSTTQITVTQEVKNAQGGKVTAVEIGEVKGDIHIDFRDKEEERDRRNKLILLQKVRDFWIKGVLERSIHGAFLIEIEKEEQPKSVEHPWSKVIYTADQPNSTIPPNKKIIDIFDELGQSLLILGDPGSGKTTEMLELAREVIARAEKDLNVPIPVVFNLSSWTNRKQNIEDWLVEELNQKYQVSKKTSRQWIESRDLMLLLDGLDEVKAEKGGACAEAINAFLQGGSCPIAVCSRIEEYQSLKVRLNLNSAILLQPLSSEQIDGYLDTGGSKFSMLKRALNKDLMLRELAKTPLMLNVMRVAYEDLPADQIAEEKMDLEERRKHLFGTYVEKMFAREARSRTESYSEERTITLLSWLATEMINHAQSVFLLEGLQISWIKSLGKKAQLMIWFLQALNFPIFIIGFVYSCYWLFCFLLGYNAGGLVGLVFIVGLASFLFIMSLGIIGTLTGITISYTGEEGIKPYQAIEFSWKNTILGISILNLRDALFRIPNSICNSERELNPSKVISILGNILSNIFPIFIGFVFFVLSLLGRMYIFIFWGIFVLFISGIKFKDIEATAYPNQGIWQLLRYSAKLAPFFALGFGLAGGLTAPDYFIASTIAASYFGFFITILFLGGFNAIVHYEIRTVLYFCKKVPLHLVDFLDHCVDRIFLQKVGGGYIFIHRMLMEYFSELEPDPR
jgi:hypothetical protein